MDGKWTHDMFESTLRTPKAGGGRGAVRAVPVMTTRGGGGGVAKATRRQPVSSRLSSVVVGGSRGGGRLASVVVASPPQRSAARGGRGAVSRAVTVRAPPRSTQRVFTASHLQSMHAQSCTSSLPAALFCSSCTRLERARWGSASSAHAGSRRLQVFDALLGLGSGCGG